MNDHKVNENRLALTRRERFTAAAELNAAAPPSDCGTRVCLSACAKNHRGVLMKWWFAVILWVFTGPHCSGTLVLSGTLVCCFLLCCTSFPSHCSPSFPFFCQPSSPVPRSWSSTNQNTRNTAGLRPHSEEEASSFRLFPLVGMEK